MNAPANQQIGVIPLARRWAWLDLATFADHLDHEPVNDALRHLEVGDPIRVVDGIRRAWIWLSGLLDSPWGLSGHLRRLDLAPEVEVLDVLDITAAQCRRAGLGDMPADFCWQAVRQAAEDATVTAQGPWRWAILHALTAAHTIADVAAAHHAPADRVAVLEAFTAMIGMVTGDAQRRYALQQAVTEWTRTDGGER